MDIGAAVDAAVDGGTGAPSGSDDSLLSPYMGEPDATAEGETSSGREPVLPLSADPEAAPYTEPENIQEETRTVEGEEEPSPSPAEAQGEGDSNPSPDADTTAASSSASSSASSAPVPALPEGVKTRVIDGKPQWVVPPDVGAAVFAKANLISDLESVIGEPVTKEALEFRQRTVEGIEALRTDLLSDSPEDQSRVVSHFLGMIARARENGEIGHDAASGFIRSTLAAGINSPDPSLRESIIKDLLEFSLDDAYRLAIETPDPALALELWGSAQRLDKANFGKYRDVSMFEEARKISPETARFNRQRKQTPSPEAHSPAASPSASAAPPPSSSSSSPSPSPVPESVYSAWRADTNAAISKSAISDPIDAVIASAFPADIQSAHPNVFQSLRDRLTREVESALRSDQALQSQLAAGNKRARLAPSPEYRNQIAQQIIKQTATRAKAALAGIKGSILSEFSQLLAAKSQSNAQRAEAGKAASATVKSGAGPSAARTAKPASTLPFAPTREQMDAEIERQLAASGL